ncbi:monocarboxylate transporter 5-like isoform X1 [Octopus sinensis]|uniref:Monocarboxylate transporter 5-like isoform X1 n=2 Tax=Octopus sinensis TaxID=2607531 RepID=A0A6P7SV84_9MOLL|nr:monocarboxylate transporter 5-like isoform X1 [Octopus sinensis]
MEAEAIPLRNPTSEVECQNVGNISKTMNCQEKTKPPLSIGQKVELVFVVFSGFVINFMVFGFAASLSVYFVKYKRAFPMHYEMVLLTIFLQTGIFSTVGMLAGMFLHKFGVRATAVLGSVLLSLGVGASCFAPNIIFLMCFFGIVSGVGSSFLFCSMNVGVASYLENSGRHLMPLVDMGGSAGGVVCPPLISYLIDFYGWRGSLLIFAAIALNSLPCGLMYSIKNRMDNNDKNSKQRQDSYGEKDIDNIYKLLSTDIEEAGKADSCYVEHNSEQLLLQSNNSHCAEETGDLARNDTSSDHCLATTPAIDDSSSLNREHSKTNDQVEDTKNTTCEISPKALFLSIFSNKGFLLFVLTMTVVVSSELTLSAMTSDFFVSKGTTRSEAAQIYGIGFTGEIIAHISSTWMLYKNKTLSLLIFCISAILSGALVTIYPSIPTMTSLSSAGSAIFLTMCEMTAHGHYQAVCILVILEFFDEKRYPFAIGFTMTVSGIFVPIFGYIFGIITQYNNNDYTVSFYLLGSLIVIFTLPTFIRFLVKREKSKRKETHQKNLEVNLKDF